MAPDFNHFSQGDLALPSDRCCMIRLVPVTKQVGCKHGRALLTQPVALNILRSKGSPESSPSILVSEWQVAMQATNALLTRLPLAASASGGEKLE